MYNFNLIYKLKYFKNAIDVCVHLYELTVGHLLFVDVAAVDHIVPDKTYHTRENPMNIVYLN